MASTRAQTGMNATEERLKCSLSLNRTWNLYLHLPQSLPPLQAQSDLQSMKLCSAHQAPSSRAHSGVVVPSTRCKLKLTLLQRPLLRRR